MFPEAVIESEKAVAIEKTKQEQVQKAVEAALKKAGINPNLVDSEAHIESNIAKGWLTEEEAARLARSQRRQQPRRLQTFPHR